jgi:xanthine dehydrogenase accessory factor
MKNIYEEIEKVIRMGEVATLATIIKTKGSTPGKVGQKMLVKSDGTTVGTVGGGCIDAEVFARTQDVIKTGVAQTFTITLSKEEAGDSGLICGGEVEIFIEPLATPSVYIFGAGHISCTISKIAKMAGFRVVVIDDREEFANCQRFPEADEILLRPFDSIDLMPSEDSYIVIVTRGHRYDQQVLEWAVKQKAKYIGMIGSKEKIKNTYENLVSRGVSKGVLERVHSPIGLDIGAKTPDEIAVSIVAELIKIRRKESSAT